jgi:hypothetical protein
MNAVKNRQQNRKINDVFIVIPLHKVVHHFSVVSVSENQRAGNNRGRGFTAAKPRKKAVDEDSASLLQQTGALRRQNSMRADGSSTSVKIPPNPMGSRSPLRHTLSRFSLAGFSRWAQARRTTSQSSMGVLSSDGPPLFLAPACGQSASAHNLEQANLECHPVKHAGLVC